MPDVPGLLADPQFKSLDPATQRQVMGRIDPQFSNLSDSDFSQFMQRMNATTTPVGQQPVSWSGMAKTLFETGKGFAKAAGRDIYGMIGEPGTAYGGGLFGRKSTPASEKITKLLESSNPSQEIGGYAERGATLLPMVEMAEPGISAFLKRPPRTMPTVPDIPSAPQGAAGSGGLKDLAYRAVRPFVPPVVAQAGKIAVENLPNPQLITRAKAAVNAYRPGLPRPSFSAAPADLSSEAAPIAGPVEQPVLPSGRVPGPAPAQPAPIPRAQPAWRQNGLQADAPTSEPQPQGPLPQPTLPSGRRPGGIGNQGEPLPPKPITPTDQRDAAVLEGLSQQYNGKAYAKLKAGSSEKAAIDNLYDKITGTALPKKSVPVMVSPASTPSIEVSAPSKLDYDPTDVAGPWGMRKAKAAPLKPSPVNGLVKPISATSPEDYTQQALDQIAAKGQTPGADLSHQNAYHVGDVSEHKALNVARHLNDEGITANDYATMVKAAKDSGDWSAIDKINDAAYETGSAGAYKGYLPKNGYSAVSAARRAERSNYQGVTTPERILEHLREYDKFRK